MRKIIKLTPLIIILLAGLCLQKGLAQDRTEKQSASKRETEKHRMRVRDSVLRAFNRADTSINGLLQRVEHYTTIFNQIKNNLSEGLDTAEASAGFPLSLKRLNKIDSLINTRKTSTLRYLFVLRDNLDHMQDDLSGWQNDLEVISAKLISNQHELIKFTKDTSLNIVPYDSAIRSAFFEQRHVTRRLFNSTDSLNRANLLKLNLLQDKITVAFTRTLDASDQIDLKIKQFAARAIAGEGGSILKPSPQFNNFNLALKATIRLNRILYNYFLKTDIAVHYICIFSFLLIFGWVYYLRARTWRIAEDTDILFGQALYISRNPVVSALIVGLAILPYFYDHPPVVFLETVFLAAMVCALILIKRHFLPETFKFLCGLFVLAIIYGLSNLFVQITNVDRYVILILSIISTVSGTIIFRRAKIAANDHLPHTCTILRIFIGLHVVSLLLNISGRFSLAKIIGITAVFNLWFGLILYFVVQILMQGLFLQFRVKRGSKAFAAYIDYPELQKKFKNVLATSATLLWVFFLLQNLNIDDWAADKISDLLAEQRSVAGSSFTFGGFVIFIIVIWLSSVFSRIVSYLYDISSQRVTDLSIAKKKNRTSALLIRIGVFSMGFLLAVSASGFPLDKLTIIISAFGVGIGFGLQNIVNNLVSGIILAFEKPLQIGDLIEVDNRSGRMLEIGIRSSKILTGDGAEVIIPNGDLISRHVINWTLSNNYRRMELIISTAHGTDVAKAEEILRDMIVAHKEIIQTPPPTVSLDNFSNASIDFKLLFWIIADVDKQRIKSDLLNKIHSEFEAQGIQIPSTSKDINLHFPNGIPALSVSEAAANNQTTGKEQNGNN